MFLAGGRLELIDMVPVAASGPDRFGRKDIDRVDSSPRCRPGELSRTSDLPLPGPGCSAAQADGHCAYVLGLKP